MYNGFAQVYDKLQSVDYTEFADYYEMCFNRFCKKKPELVLDLACGTGSVTCELAKRGYDMTGVDISPEMLDIARVKCEGMGVLLLNQDMTDFELYGTVDAIVCALDGVNYVTDKSALLKMFKWVHNYLNPDGIMVFDINSEYKLSQILPENNYIYDEDDAFCVWSSFYNDEQSICEFYIDVFNECNDGKYERFTEIHEERAYSVSELIGIINSAGLKCEGLFEGLSFDEPKSDSERILFIVKKDK